MTKNTTELQGKTVLVTGGSCFTAATLIRQLLINGATVHVTLRPTSSLWRISDIVANCHVHKLDMADAEGIAKLIQQVEPAIIFHLATAKGADSTYSDFVKTSVLGALNLISALRSCNFEGRLIVTGSSTEYAPCDQAIPESHPIKPTTLHGTVKAAAGLLYSHAALSYGLKITQLRLFHVYGPWESNHRFLPTAIHAATSGQPLPVSATLSRRDWVFVDDVVDALLLAAVPSSPSGIFNIGSGIEHDNVEIIGVIEAILGKSVTTVAGAISPRATDSEHRYADISLAKELLGWHPRHNLRQGIEKTVSWHNLNPEAWKHEHEQAPLVC
jgi:nucleoside-diphosphate-sugar epimerase